VRFFWKRDVQKKAKIMRKVTFPHELDAVEFCTDELRKALVPVRDKVREVRKDEEDVERARKRRKKNHNGNDELPEEKAAKKDEKKDDKKPATSADGDVEMTETFKTDADWEAEKDAALLEAKKELNSLIDPELRKDDGANQSGIYELRSVVTHQGASADSGHYTAYVKKTGPKDPVTGKVGRQVVVVQRRQGDRGDVGQDRCAGGWRRVALGAHPAVQGDSPSHGGGYYGVRSVQAALGMDGDTAKGIGAREWETWKVMKMAW
jgi:hypothetical protein